jgi:hypothetical protein
LRGARSGGSIKVGARFAPDVKSSVTAIWERSAMSTFAVVVLIIVIVLIAVAIWVFLRWLRQHDSAARHRTGPRTVAELVEMRGVEGQAVPPAVAPRTETEDPAAPVAEAVADPDPAPAAPALTDAPVDAVDEPRTSATAEGADTPWARGARMTGEPDGPGEPWADPEPPTAPVASRPWVPGVAAGVAGAAGLAAVVAHRQDAGEEPVVDVEGAPQTEDGPAEGADPVADAPAEDVAGSGDEPVPSLRQEPEPAADSVTEEADGPSVAAGDAGESQEGPEGAAGSGDAPAAPLQVAEAREDTGSVPAPEDEPTAVRRTVSERADGGAAVAEPAASSGAEQDEVGETSTAEQGAAGSGQDVLAAQPSADAAADDIGDAADPAVTAGAGVAGLATAAGLAGVAGVALHGAQALGGEQDGGADSAASTEERSVAGDEQTPEGWPADDADSSPVDEPADATATAEEISGFGQGAASPEATTSAVDARSAEPAAGLAAVGAHRGSAAEPPEGAADDGGTTEEPSTPEVVHATADPGADHVAGDDAEAVDGAAAEDVGGTAEEGVEPVAAGSVPEVRGGSDVEEPVAGSAAGDPAASEAVDADGVLPAADGAPAEVVGGTGEPAEVDGTSSAGDAVRVAGEAPGTAEEPAAADAVSSAGEGHGLAAAWNTEPVEAEGAPPTPDAGEPAEGSAAEPATEVPDASGRSSGWLAGAAVGAAGAAGLAAAVVHRSSGDAGQAGNSDATAGPAVAEAGGALIAPVGQEPVMDESADGADNEGAGDDVDEDEAVGDSAPAATAAAGAPPGGRPGESAVDPAEDDPSVAGAEWSADSVDGGAGADLDDDPAYEAEEDAAVAGGPTGADLAAVHAETAAEEDRRPRRTPAERAAEHAAVDVALLRTFGVAETGDRPGAAPIVSLSAAAPHQAPRVPAGPATPVLVTVLGRDDAPVAGAAAALVDDRGAQVAAAETAADGRVELTAPGPGTYMVVASAGQHQPGAVAATVTAGPAQVTVPLVRSSSVAGSVWGADEAISGAQVSLLQDGELVEETESGGDGGFRIPDLTAGAYELSVTASGFEQRVVPLEVPAAADVRHDVDLQPSTLVGTSPQVPSAD